VTFTLKSVYSNQTVANNVAKINYTLSGAGASKYNAVGQSQVNIIAKSAYPPNATVAMTSAPGYSTVKVTCDLPSDVLCVFGPLVDATNNTFDAATADIISNRTIGVGKGRDTVMVGKIPVTYAYTQWRAATADLVFRGAEPGVL